MRPIPQDPKLREAQAFAELDRRLRILERTPALTPYPILESKTFSSPSVDIFVPGGPTLFLFSTRMYTSTNGGFSVTLKSGPSTIATQTIYRYSTDGLAISETSVHFVPNFGGGTNWSVATSASISTALSRTSAVAFAIPADFTL